MFNISGFLDKFIQLSATNSFLKKTVSDAIFSVTGFRLDEKDIEIFGKKAKIKQFPVLKTEIFLKKEKILQKLLELKNETTKEIV